MKDNRSPYFELEEIVAQFIEGKGILLPRGVLHEHVFHALDQLVRQNPPYSKGKVISHAYERTGALATTGALVIDRELPLVGRERELFGTMQVFGVCPVGDEYHLVSQFHGLRDGKLHTWWECHPTGFVDQVIGRLDERFGVVDAKRSYAPPLPAPRIRVDEKTPKRGIGYLLRNTGIGRLVRLFEG